MVDKTRVYTAQYRLNDSRFLKGVSGLIEFKDGRIVERTYVELVDKLDDFELNVKPKNPTP